MSRQDTVNKYIDQFLKGRGPESCERFRSKSLDKQYSSIMQWRRKLRREESTPKSTREIIDALRRVNALVGNAPEMGKRITMLLWQRLTRCWPPWMIQCAVIVSRRFASLKSKAALSQANWRN